MLLAYAYYVGRRRGYVGRATRAGLGEVGRGFLNALLAMLMPMIIIGGIISGVFTPTESGVVAVVYALVLGLFITRRGEGATLTPAGGAAMAITPSQRVVITGTAARRVEIDVAPELIPWDRWNHARTAWGAGSGTRAISGPGGWTTGWSTATRWTGQMEMRPRGERQ